jgi:hypothetical protein
VTIGNTRAIYVNPGYLLFVREGTLMAQRFNTSKLEITGDANPVAEQVDSGSAPGAVLGHFSASQNGRPHVHIGCRGQHSAHLV